MPHDPIRNPEGELRRAAGGSSTGTSTGAAIIGTEDPLAGLRAATPGLDATSGGNPDLPELPASRLLRGAEMPTVTSGGGGGGLAVLLAIVAFVWVMLRE